MTWKQWADDWKTVVTIIVFASYVLFCETTIDGLKTEAIERGHAHYHPQTGKWEWKEKP